MENEYLVAFLDMLGTKDLIRSGRFSDLHILDFINTAGLAAKQIPSVRFAAFSDCIIASTSQEKFEDFVAALSYCYSQWCADHIWVRGGISIGDVRWVDDPGVDNFFDNIKNFNYSRIYGSAVVSAYQTERSSGPGSICFVDDKASKFLISKSSFFITKKNFTDALVWAREPEVKRYLQVFRDLYESAQHPDYKRQLLATLKYFESLSENDLYIPSSFGLGPQYITQKEC
jgi:hypothetical protein